MKQDLLNVFSAIVSDGNLDAAIDWALSLDSSSKSAFAKFASKELKSLVEYDELRILVSESVASDNFTKDILRSCIFVTSSLSDIKKVPYLLNIFESPKLFGKIVAKHQPPWLEEWINWVLDDSPRYYWLARTLFLNGSCKKPTSDHYILGMIYALGYNRRSKGTMLDAVLENRDILEHDIWRLFEIEGGGEFSLAAHDKYTLQQNSWFNTLRCLCEQNYIDRERLLNCTLEALSKDFAQFRAGWYSRFFLILEPTIEEIVKRQPQLLFLLGSQIPPTVSFALKQLQSINKNKQLNCNAFLNAVEPVLLATTKSTVLGGLRLLESAVKQKPDLSSSASRLAVNALYLENADVQKKALDIIDKTGVPNDAELQQLLRSMKEFILPSQMNRLMLLIGDDEVHSETQANTLDETDGHREFNQARQVDKIQDFETLISEWSQILETPEDPIQIELALSGLSSVGRAKPANFDTLTGPLKKRANTLFKRGPDNWLQHILARLVLCYLGSENLFATEYQQIRKASQVKFADVFVARLFYLAESF